MWQVGDQCYASRELAADALAATLHGVAASPGTLVQAVSTGDGDAVRYSVLRLSDMALLSEHVVDIELAPCALWSVADAVQGGWLVVATWLAVYAVIWLSRIVWFSLLGGKDDT